VAWRETPTDRRSFALRVRAVRAVLTKDKHGKTLAIRGALWSAKASWQIQGETEARPSLFVTLLGHGDDEDDCADDLAWLKTQDPAFYGGLHFYTFDMTTFGSEPGRDGAHLLVLWRLAQQMLGVRYHEPSPRPLRRSAERQGLTDSGVVVVRLRRPEHVSQHGDPGEAHYSHRFIVSGHWRNQAVKGGHRLTWIAPYVKGDPELPLVVKPHVVVVDR
jgi:hypothetical protein